MALQAARGREISRRQRVQPPTPWCGISTECSTRSAAFRLAPERAGEDAAALVASWKKLDDMTVEITTRKVDSIFPYQMLWFLISSPAQYEKLGKDWDKFAMAPSGTGPFKLDKVRAARARRAGEER